MSPPRRSVERQGGFSLVEAMVGIAVGLATVLVITQTMSLFQGGRNTAVSGAGAQENGLFAMHLLATDIRSSGAGSYAVTATGTQNLYNCTNVCSYYSGNGTAGSCSNSDGTTASPTNNGAGAVASMSGKALTGAAYSLNLPLFPVIIETGDSASISNVIQYSAQSDIVTVRSPTRFIGSVPALLNSNADMDMSGLITTRTYGFKTGDLVLVATTPNCTLFQVTAINSTSKTLSHAAADYNPTSFTWGTSSAGKTYSTSASLYNLGSTSDANGPFVANEYSVASGGTTLQMRTIGKSRPTSSSGVLSMADGIVTMKAQYGIAASATAAAVSNWVGTDSASWETTWKPDALTSANAGLIRAVRIMVVARSSNREASTVTQACTTEGYTNGPCPSGGTSEITTSTTAALPPINLAALPWNTSSGEWQHYRYKIYTTVVPIRNILWNGTWNYTGGSYTGQ